MLSGLPSFILMPFSFLLFLINLAFCGTFVFIGGFLKFILPFKKFHQQLYRPMHTIYRLWAANNTAIIKLVNNVDWQVTGLDKVKKECWYLMISNHQSWLDIFVATDLARNKMPEPKFFLKESLRKVPFVGMACWALDMPFMKRYSKAFIEKHPHLKGQDIETTKKSCQSFKTNPTSIINFVEGTRFTPTKHKRQQSELKHLLTPKAGGIAFTLASLGEHFDKVVNVTMLYPNNTGNIMIDVLCGRLSKIVVHVELMDVTPELIGDYFNDTDFKEAFQLWLNDEWHKKDKLITQLLAESELADKQSTSPIDHHIAS